MKDFARRLIAESLFYDAEFGTAGNLSLVDETSTKEWYVASFVVEEERFVIEKAIAWEDEELDPEIGYLLAIDFDEHSVYETALEAADAILALAEEQGLAPSLTVTFDEEDG